MKLKHWLKLADALRAVRPAFNTPDIMLRCATWAACVDSIADALEVMEGRTVFNRQKWMAYVNRE